MVDMMAFATFIAIIKIKIKINSFPWLKIKKINKNNRYLKNA